MFDLPAIFGAGLLTFASPCVLPLVPVYLATLAGASVGELRNGGASRRRLLASTGAFALGLAGVFVALGFAASAVAQTLASYRGVLQWAAGGLVVVFGLKTLGVLRIPLLDRSVRPLLNRFGAGGTLVGSFALGAAFALGWTPCVGPVLGSVLSYAANHASRPLAAASCLAIYAAGLVAPLFAAAAFAPTVLRLLDRAKPYLRTVELATGALLVAVGVLVATGGQLPAMPWRAGDADVARSAITGPAAGAEACSGTTTACAIPASPAIGGVQEPLPDFAPAPRGPAVIEYMSHDCPACREMEPVVREFRRACGQMRFEQRFVDSSTGIAEARQRGVRGIPTYVVLDESGREIDRLVGVRPVRELRAAAESASGAACTG
jgi:cytochrome c-type biogenesis protein